MHRARFDAEGNPAPPWGCGRWNGSDKFGDPMICEWGNLCSDCEPDDGYDYTRVPVILNNQHGSGEDT